MQKLVTLFILFRTMMAICIFAVGETALAEGQSVTIFKLTDRPEQGGIGEAKGTITLEDTPHGLKFTVNLTGLPPGEHGFHVHEHGSCASMLKDGKMTLGAGAGDHYDPNNTDSHKGPYSTKGHLGDLPILLVDENGNSRLAIVAPRLKRSQIQGRTIIIHQNSDNYLDYPNPLGGGGPRIACGIIK
ncbi:MAG: superoxide dismutase [Cu-Zn] SodC [Gammaproteobacteria bacterium]